MRFDNEVVVIVGGGSGIGRAVAAMAAKAGAEVVVSSRSQDKLNDTIAEIGAGIALPVDMTDQWSVEGWAEALPAFDHLVTSASSAAHGPFATADEAAIRAMFDTKFFGPYAVAKAALPKLRKGGSITFFSGVLSRRPGANCTGLGAVNGAVEALARGLALELGPDLRVNCMSPGMVRSDAYAGIDPDKREAMYQATGESLPIGRVGKVDEIAEATLFLMRNGYTTGVVLDSDGGHMVRQYATR
ncbi:MAG: SDR family oxidoreductase [Pseudomonadota bacterium]